MKAKGTLLETDGPTEDMYFLAMPVSTYKALSDTAAQRGLTVAQVLRDAVRDYLEKTESVADKGPKLLLEAE